MKNNVHGSQTITCLNHILFQMATAAAAASKVDEDREKKMEAVSQVFSILIQVKFNDGIYETNKQIYPSHSHKWRSQP